MTFSSLFTATSNIARIQNARADLATAGIDTTAEIVTWWANNGRAEAVLGFDAITGIDESYLRTIRPDVLAAVQNGIFTSATEWYLNNTGNDGLAALVAPNASFNATAYLAANTDLGAAGLTTAAQALSHYITYGADEGRAADGTGVSGVTGSTFALTTSVDTVVGTDNNDTITALQTGGADSTFGAADDINGGAGTDTINITNTAGAAASAATVTNVENVSYRSTAAGGTLDMDNFIGATSLTLDRTVGANNVSNVALTTGTTFKTSSATMDTTLTYKASGVTGSTDSASVVFNGVVDGAELDFAGAVETMAISTTGSASQFDNLVFDAGTTAITIAADEALTVDDTWTAAGVTNLTVTGDSLVTITPTLAAATVTVDSSAQTAGGLSVVLGGNAAFTGGAGNDVVNTTANTTQNIVGGDGTDTVVFTASTNYATTATKVSGFETLRGSGVGATYNVSSLSGITAVEAGATGGTLTFTGLTSQGITVQNNITTLVTTLSNSTGTSDALTFTIDDIDTTPAAITVGAITAAGVETLNIVTTETLAAGNPDVISAFTGSTSATTVNVSGTNAVTLSNISALAANALVDGSTMTKVFTVTGADAGDTVKGGSAADVFSVAFGSLGTTTSFVGGTGDDTLTVTGNGSDIIDADFTALTGIDNLVIGSATTTSVTLQGFAQTALGTVDANSDGNIDITAASLTTGGTIDGSALTTVGIDVAATLAVGGGVDGTATLALLGGAQNDTFTFTVNDAADTGNDATVVNVTTGNGIDTVVSTKTDGTGAGTDVLNVISSSTTTANADIITGFETTLDKFDYNGTLQAAPSGNVDTGATITASIAVAGGQAGYLVSTDIANSGANTQGDAFSALLGASASTLATLYDAFETQILATGGALNGTITGLDADVTSGESVLIGLDNGTGSVVMRFSNTTASGNTIEAGELELVGVFTNAVLAVGDFS